MRYLVDYLENLLYTSDKLKMWLHCILGGLPSGLET